MSRPVPHPLLRLKEGTIHIKVGTSIGLIVIPLFWGHFSWRRTAAIIQRTWHFAAISSVSIGAPIVSVSFTGTASFLATYSHYSNPFGQAHFAPKDFRSSDGGNCHRRVVAPQWSRVSKLPRFMAYLYHILEYRNPMWYTGSSCGDVK